jgi:tyrosine aminotransferase
LEIAISVMGHEGDNMLVPEPGFPLYQTIMENKGIEVRKYRLNPEKGWEIDLEHMASLMDAKTKAVCINNPSNPCGSNFSKAHLEAFLRVCAVRKVPCISDEIYANMVFGEETFHPLADLKPSIPILTVGGLAKQYLVPGWRMGWVLIKDGKKPESMAPIRQALVAQSQIILGSSSILQGALPAIFNNVPASFYQSLNATLSENATFLFERLSALPGLHPVQPQGAMYLMVRVDMSMMESAITSELVFVERLIEEESVFLLPGSCFGAKDFVRLVTCPSREVLEDACNRIENFMNNHRKA